MLVLMSQYDMAVFMLLSLSSYARPSSLLRLQARHMVAPTARAKFWALLLDPLEEGKPSKTGEFDNSVILDQPWVVQLSPALAELAARPATESVWPFDYGEYASQFRQASLALGISVVPYQARHSGASLDRMNGFRSLLEVKGRGGWKLDSSVLRYEKHARLGFSEQAKDPRLISYGETCAARLADIILHRRGVAPPAGLKAMVPRGTC